MSTTRAWLAGGAVTGLLILTAGVALVVNDAPGVTSSSPTAVPAASSAAAPTSSAVPDLSWVEAGGVALPVSAMHGPRELEDGRAVGYALSEQGAALAAVNLLVRSGPTVPAEVFEATITEQTTGPNVAALRLAVQEQHGELGTAAEPDPAQVQGYRVAAFRDSPGSATVEVFLGSSDLASQDRALQVTVAMLWVNGDWRLVAPPKGDWQQVSTPLGALPPGMLRYEDLG
jgi:hypothetical protein